MLSSHEQFPKALEFNSYGYALYHPKPASFLQPGDCGYFDEQGDWHRLLSSIAVPNSNSAMNSKIEMIEISNDELHPGKPETWGPVTSEGVSYTSAGVQGQMSHPGSPGTLDVKLEFSKKQEYGAALLTGPTVRKSYFQRPLKFHVWTKKNARSIVQNFPDVTQHDLWVITKVCQTPRCIIGTWSDQEKSFLCLGGGALVNNSLTLNADWRREQTSGSWRFFDQIDKMDPNKPESKKQTNMQGKKRDDWVIFVEGLKYRYSKVLDAMKMASLTVFDVL
ncbi:hypothetical protein BDZ45DRAFT_725488 [Acephala macrosclerotiorum]|nr:hypothetical protein BDZ45DRAFT_725488 [Acephala macrosclerotiorum]